MRHSAKCFIKGDDLMINFNNSITGVWVGKNIEIVRTGIYELVFQRNDNILESTWSHLEYDSNYLIKTLMAKCCYMPDGMISYAYKIEDAEENIYSGSNSSVIEKELGKSTYSIKQRDDSIMIIADDLTEKICGNNLYIEKENKKIVLQKSENIEIVNNRDILPLSQSSIEDCLVSWRLGTKDGVKWERDDSIDPFVEINTKNHMYIFVVSDRIKYCRAARYAVCEQGVVFAQNFRLFEMEGRGKQAYMVSDNLIAKEPLIIDPELFSFESCQTTPKERGGVQAGIYWSVKEADDNKIILHGCDGEEFIWRRNDYKSEYFS